MDQRSPEYAGGVLITWGGGTVYQLTIPGLNNTCQTSSYYGGTWWSAVPAPVGGHSGRITRILRNSGRSRKVTAIVIRLVTVIIYKHVAELGYLRKNMIIHGNHSDLNNKSVVGPRVSS